MFRLAEILDSSYWIRPRWRRCVEQRRQLGLIAYAVEQPALNDTVLSTADCFGLANGSWRMSLPQLTAIG